MKMSQPLAILIAIILLTVSVIPACAPRTDESIVSSTAPAADENIILSPVRIARSRFSNCWLEIPSLESLVNQHAAAACVRIGNWLGEGDYTTFFTVVTTHRIAGEVPESFILAQAGDSTASYSVPFFKYGNEHLVFLLKNEFPSAGFEDFYYTPFDYAAVFDIIELPSGEKFALDRFGLLSETLVRHIRNYADDAALVEQIEQSLIENDSTWASLQLHIRSAFDPDELIAYLTKILNTGDET